MTTDSCLSAVLLRPLPYPSPDRLTVLWTHNPRQGYEKDVSTYPNFDDWRRLRDPITFVALPLGLLVVTVLATLIPAARACASIRSWRCAAISARPAGAYFRTS